MTLEVYDIGEPARLSAVFYDINGSEEDPTTLDCKVLSPSGALSIYAFGGAVVVRDSKAHYHMDLTLDEVGDWHYEWEGTGLVLAVEPGIVRVRGTGF